MMKVTFGKLTEDPSDLLFPAVEGYMSHLRPVIYAMQKEGWKVVKIERMQTINHTGLIGGYLGVHPNKS